MFENENEKGMGERIKKYRKERGLSQNDLAEALGISYMTVRRWEAGKRVPSSKMLEPLCKVLEVTPFKILFDGHKASEMVVDELKNKGESVQSSQEAALEFEKQLDGGEIAPTLSMGQQSGELFLKNGDIEIRMPDNAENQKIFSRIVERMLDSLSVSIDKEETPASLPAPVGVSKSA